MSALAKLIETHLVTVMLGYAFWLWTIQLALCADAGLHQALYPTITFKNLTLAVNLGSSLGPCILLVQ